LVGAGLAEAFPTAEVTSLENVHTIDFGAGIEIGGIVFTGATQLDASALEIDPDGLRGRLVERSLGLTVAGRPAPFESLEVDIDLAHSEDRLFGTIAVTGTPAKTGGAGISGSLTIDSEICLFYPVSGSIQLTSPDGETITISFGPECDGSFQVDVEPAWDWEYRHQNPLTTWAHSHIVEVVNAHVTSDVADYWIPDVGGTEFFGRDNPGDTPPGIITYRFSFANPTTSAWLDTDAATFHYEASRGHTYLLASRDGISWTVVNDVPPPTNPGDPPRNGHYIGPVPAAALGGNELWVRLELYAYGPSAPAGFTNTAQHARYWDEMPRDTFILQVECGGGNCGG
jgi:hypothetical protein